MDGWAGYRLFVGRLRDFLGRAVSEHKAVTSATIIALGLVVGAAIWASYNRYYILSGPDGVAYEVDRLTGRSWVLLRGGKIPHEIPHRSDSAKDKELPYAEAAKVTGYASLGYGSLSGELYNGSSWTVTKVVVTVSAKDRGGLVKWSRDYVIECTIRPLTTESFYVKVAGTGGVVDAPWAFKKVFGYKE